MHIDSKVDEICDQCIILNVMRSFFKGVKFSVNSIKSSSYRLGGIRGFALDPVNDSIHYSGGSATPTANPTFGGTPNSSAGGNTTGAMPGSAFTPGIGIAPTGTGFGNLDGSSALLPHFTTVFMLLSFSFALLFSPRI